MTETQRNTEELLKEVNNNKSEDLEILLIKIQSKIDQSKEKDKDLLSAKTMITSRLASRKVNNNYFKKVMIDLLKIQQISITLLI